MEIPLLLYMIILILMIIPNKSLLFSLFVARFPIYVQFMITSIIWQFPYNLLANSLVVFLFAGRFPIYSTINNSMAISGTDLLEVYYHIRGTFPFEEWLFPSSPWWCPHSFHGNRLGNVGSFPARQLRRTWRKSWMGIGPGTAWFQVDEILQFNHNICKIYIHM